MYCELLEISLQNGVAGISQSALNCPNNGIFAGRAELFHVIFFLTLFSIKMVLLTKFMRGLNASMRFPKPTQMMLVGDRRGIFRRKVEFCKIWLEMSEWVKYPLVGFLVGGRLNETLVEQENGTAAEAPTFGSSQR